jgi:hypothetical protein
MRKAPVAKVVNCVLVVVSGEKAVEDQAAAHLQQTTWAYQELENLNRNFPTPNTEDKFLRLRIGTRRSTPF